MVIYTQSLIKSENSPPEIQGSFQLTSSIDEFYERETQSLFSFNLIFSIMNNVLPFQF